MAVCEPRLDWLREQLESLNAQTYPNLELLIRDDCSPTVPYPDICALAAECITRFPYTIARNEANLGSNGTFERLTEKANGVYIAYCDQDDIWLPEKLEALQFLMTEGVAFAYGDMSVMDSTGRQVAPTLRDIRPRLEYRHGPDLESFYFFRNCTAGCSMLVLASLAKAAVPFPEKTVCDQWICSVASKSGEAVFTDRPQHEIAFVHHAVCDSSARQRYFRVISQVQFTFVVLFPTHRPSIAEHLPDDPHEPHAEHEPDIEHHNGSAVDVVVRRAEDKAQCDAHGGAYGEYRPPELVERVVRQSLPLHPNHSFAL
jgi:glycosyltransferase involved in cell wall biosynthesis